MGAVAPYDQATIMPELCEMISRGMLVREAAALLNVSTVSIRRWGASEEWRTAYTRAREDQAHAMAEEVWALAKTATPENYNAIRVQVDTAKWLTSKIAPRLFGEKIQVEHSAMDYNSLSDDELRQVAAGKTPQRLLGPGTP